MDGLRLAHRMMAFSSIDKVGLSLSVIVWMSQHQLLRIGENVLEE